MNACVAARTWWWAVVGCLAATGLVLGWNNGQLPPRDVRAVSLEGSSCQAQSTGGTPVATCVRSDELAPDLALYCEVIARVRGGEDYYAVAAEAIPSYGFPISSPLNWRLPTYAWLLSRLPCPGWIQLVLISLSLAALALAVVAKGRSEGPLTAFLCGLLLLGALRWAIDGYACVAQEPWAATLVVISLASHALAQRDARWTVLAIASGTAALLLRELALPYCAAAWSVALVSRRWWQTVGWSAGMAAFVAFYIWHMGQVHAHLPGGDVEAASGGVSQWLRLGGLDFVLLTTRMNGLLFAAASGVLWLYLLAALIGLARRTDPTSLVAALATLAYLLAFAILGRPENFYWGLLPAPLLAWGAASAPEAIRNALRDFQGGDFVEALACSSAEGGPSG